MSKRTLEEKKMEKEEEEVVSREMERRRVRARPRGKTREEDGKRRGERPTDDWSIRASEWCRPRPIGTVDLLRGLAPFIDQAPARTSRTGGARFAGPVMRDHRRDPCRPLPALPFLSSIPRARPLRCPTSEDSASYANTDATVNARNDRPIIHAPPGTWSLHFDASTPGP